MTEQEFNRQVWRPYDTIELVGDEMNGTKRKVLNVCFSTKSVRVRMSGDNAEWVRCEMIASHQSICGNTEDTEIIEDLHNKLMAANKRNEDLQLIKVKLESQISKCNTGELRRCVNILASTLVEKKKTIESIEKAVARINESLNKNENNEEV